MAKWEEELRETRERKLFEKRTLLLDGDITMDALKRIKQGVHVLALESTDPVTLLIDSRGGQVEAAIEFYDFVRTQCAAPLIGRVTGKCASAAVPLLQSCGRREATRNSWFLVHSVALDLSDYFKGQKFQVGTDMERALRLVRSSSLTQQRIVEQILAQRTHRPLAEVRRWMHRGDTDLEMFRAPEAKRRGLIDRII